MRPQPLDELEPILDLVQLWPAGATELQIPDDFQVQAMAPSTDPVRKNCFPKNCRHARVQPDRRKISESTFEGPFKPK